jgi:4-hydroxy-2-oxoheptanedioate aldolase
MPVRLSLPPSFATVIAEAHRPQVGMWVCTGSPLVAEICAGSGLDWLLIDMEHAPNGLESVLAQLQAVGAYPITPLVRVPSNDVVTIKQVLDLGAQNILVPMIDTAAEAAAAVAAMRYPPEGLRGVGSALGRGARWNRVDKYLHNPSISITVQIETTTAVANVEEIARSGVDAIFVGPSDLAASMGFLGEQENPEVVDAVERCIAVGKRVGVPVGVNSFTPSTAERYLGAGVTFVLVGADVSLLARGSEALADRFIDGTVGPTPTSY